MSEPTSGARRGASTHEADQAPDDLDVVPGGGDGLRAFSRDVRARAGTQDAQAQCDALVRGLETAETEELTGTRSKGAGLADFDREIVRARRTSGELSVAYVHVMGLETTIDAHGPAAGDALLAHAVSAIRGRLRSYDSIVRLSDDAFLCVLSGATLDDARQRFDAIHADLEADSEPCEIRVGFGLLAPTDSVAELIDRADPELPIGRRRPTHGTPPQSADHGGEHREGALALAEGDSQPDVAGLDAGTDPERRVMKPILAGLFAAGASLGVLAVLLPHPGRLNEGGLLAVIATAYLSAALLLVAFARAPAWGVREGVLRAAVASGSTLITAAAYFSGEHPSPLIFFYLWIFLYSTYFFTPRQAAAQIAFVGVLYGVLLAVARPPAGVVLWWLVAMGAMLVGAAVILVMRRRNDRLVACLHDLARTDPLTELTNQRGFREALDREIERARREGATMSLVVGDIDHFKRVNDRLGHPAGDAVLRRTARILKDGARRIDTAARQGGEEFAVLLPGVDQKGAFVLAERLRCRVRDEFSRDPVPVTISFGVATYPADGHTVASLLINADRALYTAKRRGRDRTMLRASKAVRRASRPSGLEGAIAGKQGS